jgi:hypothetical protein
MAEDTLPQMPEPRTLSRGDEDGPIQLGYTADQLRAYAVQAVAQERERADREWRQRIDVEIGRRLEVERRFHSLLESVASKEALLPRTVVLAGSHSPQPAPAGFPVSADERALRRLLAVRVAMACTYGDDGEMQGSEHGIFIDFMREPVADIDAKLRALNVARAICAQPPAIPAGWRLVPEEPTAEMLEASHHWLSSLDMRLCWRYVLAAAPQPPSAWRPISEAPKDGTDVLIYVADTAEQFVGYWRDDSNAFVIAPNGRGGWTGLKEPTHWMPLPPPPSAGEEPST